MLADESVSVSEYPAAALRSAADGKDPARMTTSGSAVHHKMVLNEIWHFAEYIVAEIKSHGTPNPPLSFADESRWNAAANAATA